MVKIIYLDLSKRSIKWNGGSSTVALFGWLWLVAGADLLSDKSTASWLVADTDLV